MTPEEHSSRLHAAIMNLPCKVHDEYATTAPLAFVAGHRDARHAAAELAQEAIAAALESQAQQLADARLLAKAFLLNRATTRQHLSGMFLLTGGDRFPVAVDTDGLPILTDELRAALGKAVGEHA